MAISSSLNLLALRTLQLATIAADSELFADDAAMPWRRMTGITRLVSTRGPEQTGFRTARARAARVRSSTAPGWP